MFLKKYIHKIINVYLIYNVFLVKKLLKGEGNTNEYEKI